jgi:alpha-tubulin suppressor-like RCC1 family protein
MPAPEPLHPSGARARRAHIGVRLAAWCALLLAALAPAAAAEPSGGGSGGAFLDVGPAHACAVQQDRIVRCWGRGASGALGSRAIDDRLAAPGSAASSVNLGAATQIAAGDLSTCAIVVGGAVRCWGQGASGQLGSRERDNRLDGYADPRTGTDEASIVPLGATAQQVSVGSGFACAIVDGGAVRCWGGGLAGRTGGGDTAQRLDGLADGASDEPSTVPLGGAAIAVAASELHACALLTGGAVRCWGSGGSGRLGSGATDDRLDGTVGGATQTDEASTVALGGAAVAIAAGSMHTCALMTTGDVRCWGLGTSGQIGNGNNYEARLDGAGEIPTTVPIKPVGTTAAQAAKTANLKAIAITAGDAHTCAIVESGDVRCWGLGTSGQLGQGATDSRLDGSLTTPADAATRVGGGPDGRGPGLGAAAIAISAAGATTCATLSTQAVRCWGAGDGGRLGSSATDRRLDGVIDSVTGTDDASIVPIGGLPATPSDGIPPATPTPTPVAAPQPGLMSPGSPAPLAATLSLTTRLLRVRILLAPTTAGRCPKRVGISVKLGKRKIAKRTLAAKRKGADCRIAGTVALRRAVKRGAKVSVHVSAAGVTARDFTVARR